MNIDSLEFWETVEREFGRSREVFLCCGSPTFCHAYESKENRHRFQKLKRKFLWERKSILDHFFDYLFTSSETPNRSSNILFAGGRNVRLQFVDWSIARLQKPLDAKV